VRGNIFRSAVVRRTRRWVGVPPNPAVCQLQVVGEVLGGPGAGQWRGGGEGWEEEGRGGWGEIQNNGEFNEEKLGRNL